MGWKPRFGLLPYRWEGYNEALLLYVLGLASPTHPIPPKSYKAWLHTYKWKKLYGIEFLFAGSLFIHQFSHLWIDFRVIQDEYMRAKGIDYFKNSRRATLVQRLYAIRNPKKFAGYNANCWGISACDGPGLATRILNGKKTRFYEYMARKIPFGPDDGTIAPWAAITSLALAPEIVLPAIDHFRAKYPILANEFGLRRCFNPSVDWISDREFALAPGPMVLMIENYRTGSFWNLMRGCEHLANGLRRAGFTGGWL
jgi:hypothetical protein